MAPVPKHKYTQQDVLEAVRQVQSKSLTLHQACRIFKIPYSTLGDKVRGRRPMNPQSRTLLRPIEEERLVFWIMECAKRGFGKSRSDIKDAVKAILDARGAKTQSADNRPSKQWLKDFFKHHPELADRTPSALGKERALVSRSSLESWFNEMKEFMDKQDPTILSSPERIYNADETGFSFCPKAKKIIATKGSKHVYSLASNTKQTITVMACCSATGHYLPPLIIYPYKRTPSVNLLQGFEEAMFQITPNGWINSNVFLTWLRDCFIPSVAEKRKPVLLFVDGHPSHLSSLEIVDICQENSIILYCLKSHASHIIQPLDQALFGAMKSKWEAAAKAYISKTGESVSIRTFASTLKPVWEATTTPEMAFNGFSKSGIFPFNPSRVLNSEKLGPNQTFIATPPSGSGLSQSHNESASSTISNVDTMTLTVSTSPDTPSTSATTSTQEKDESHVHAPFSSKKTALQNVRKLLQFTVQAGPEKFENLWSNYVDSDISSGLTSDPQYSEFKQLLDAVINTNTKNDIYTCTPSEEPSTSNKSDDIFALPQFLPKKSSNPGFGFKPNVQKKSMPMAISGTEFREYLNQKEKEKEDITSAKEKRKMEREENKKRKLAEQEERKKIAAEKKQKREEEKRAKEAMKKKKAGEALLLRILKENEKENDDSADSDEDEGLKIVYDDETASEAEDEFLNLNNEVLCEACKTLSDGL